MKYPIIPYRIFPLGDAALTVDFGNSIDETLNSKILNWVYSLRVNPPEGMIEVTPAYNSFTVYYHVIQIKKAVNGSSTAFEFMKQKLDEFLQQAVTDHLPESSLIEIPVCYDAAFAADIDKLSVVLNLSHEEIIHTHISRIYKIYMLGFLPGFAYMGQLDDRISLPRKSRPENITSGSVGIAGTQTGIYPLTSPGGWHIIGRTPLRLFNKEKDDPVLLKPGNRIKFISISRYEFENY